MLYILNCRWEILNKSPSTNLYFLIIEVYHNRQFSFQMSFNNYHNKQNKDPLLVSVVSKRKKKTNYIVIVSFHEYHLMNSSIDRFLFRVNLSLIHIKPNGTKYQVFHNLFVILSSSIFIQFYRYYICLYRWRKKVLLCTLHVRKSLSNSVQGNFRNIA